MKRFRSTSEPTGQMILTGSATSSSIESSRLVHQNLHMLAFFNSVCRRLGASGEEVDSRSPMAGFSPQLRSELIVRLVDGEVIVLDRSQERIHRLNETAGFIFRQCERGGERL